MRPIRLVIEGLRSFRAPVAIDFGDRDHIAIIGDTGAGKSSILEAMTYALYGKTTFAAQANQELMNDTSTRLRVVLRFRVSGDEWEAVRTLRRAGDNTVGGVTATLQRLDTSGKPVELVEQVTPVNDRVVELIGLNRDAFLRTVVLPQGRFARLLVEDNPAYRSVILRQVWRTDEIEEAGRLAHDAREEILKTRIRLEAEAARYPKNPAIHLTELQDKSDQASAAAQVTAELESRAAESAGVLERARAQNRLALRVIESLTPAAPSLDVLEPISVKAEEIGLEQKLLSKNRDALVAKLSSIPVDDDGPAATDVEAAIAQLDSLLQFLVGDAEAQADNLRKHREEAKGKSEAAAGKAKSARDAAEKEAAHGRGREQLAEVAQMERNRRDAMAAHWDACANSGSALAQATEGLIELQSQDGELETQYAAAVALCERFEHELNLVKDHLTLSQRANLAATVARGLHAGEDCPICSRQLEPDWVAPASGDLAEAEEALKNAERRADDASHHVTSLETKRHGLRERIDQQEVSVQCAEKRHEAALSELARMVDAKAEQTLPDRAKFVQPFDTAIAVADLALADHDKEHQKLVSEHQTLETEARIAEESASNAEATARATDQEAIRALRRVADALQSIPQAYKLWLPLPVEPGELRSVDVVAIEARRAEALARRTVLAHRASKREQLQRELSTTQAGLDEVRERRRREVDSPTQDVVQQANDYRDALREAARQLEADLDLPRALNTRSIDEVAARITDQLDWANRLATKAKASRRDASRAEAKARADLTGISEQLGMVFEGAEETVARARDAATEADFGRKRAKKQLENFEAVKRDIEDLLVLVREVSAKERALSDLESALKPGAFMKWLTQRRSRSLLLHASRTLKQMTYGRLAFAHPHDVEDRWRIFDRESGQARSPDSLSGGEQFIASLALAIGLVEMMARSGGHLESLFLDEGFGALDRSNLDAALGALTTAVTAGRMLGVISHVRGVAEQFDHVLAVTRDVSGSTAEWLTDQQRDEIAEPEPSSVLSGMLD